MSYLLNVLQLCNASFCKHDIYCFCPSGERDPPLALLKVSSLSFYFSQFFLILCEVKGQGVCVQIVKPSEAHL